MLKTNLRRYVSLYPVLGLLGACANADKIVTVCNSSIYCGGELLRTVQLAKIFPDSKTFVDLKLVSDEKATLNNFFNLMNETKNDPSRMQLMSFLDQHFEDQEQLSTWYPPDFDPNPPVLDQIVDPTLRQFAKDIIGIWPKLGRKVTDDVGKHPEKYSIIYLPNGFIIPGGRFKELYYWDSYWIIRGLLISNMTRTAKGMIGNLLHLVNKIGYIPNGSRIYYLGRSQPPLLAWMVSDYFDATGDLKWLKRNIETVERELQFWLSERQVEVVKNGVSSKLLHYESSKDDTGPRPESYYEDYTNGQTISEGEREKFYREMKSAAESGWDFSSRWFVANGMKTRYNITDINISRILPVDLNSIFAGSLQRVGDLRNKLGNKIEAQKWWILAKLWRHAIDNVFWNDKDGVWYDFDYKTMSPRKNFYLSCAAPLWAGAVEATKMPERSAYFVEYLRSTGALKFPGGVPTTMWQSGEQWDFPNAWPPLQSILIGALENSNNAEARQLAREQVEIWLHANYIGYHKWQQMFEKYSCLKAGSHGSGGEYNVQAGFGWTNGLVLELLQRYGKVLTFKNVPK